MPIGIDWISWVTSVNRYVPTDLVCVDAKMTGCRSDGHGHVEDNEWEQAKRQTLALKSSYVDSTKKHFVLWGKPIVAVGFAVRPGDLA